jgi:transglutaminase-like putative cysteine protease
MNRRDFLQSSTLAAAGALAGVPARGAAAAPAGASAARYAPDPAHGWRRFEVVTRIEPRRHEGVTRVWVPLPSLDEPGWQRSMGSLWQGNADVMRSVRDAAGAEVLYAEWQADAAAPELEVITRFMTRDRAIDFGRPSAAPLALPPDQQALYTRATALLPTDGIVRESAAEIVQGARDDEEKARGIYEWIVDNTFREPTVRGCGTGDIRAMLETGYLAGKCADLNALFVGLARSVGLPARDVYGVRVADSRFGYQSLGRSGDISKAQHCRAEVFLARFGWVPVDPADVRKVVLEEPPGNLAIIDPKVAAVRKALFGAWEMNWLAYNDAHDLQLPGSAGAAIPFLMYPQGEDAAGRFDSLDPAGFSYSLTSREIG